MVPTGSDRRELHAAGWASSAPTRRLPALHRALWRLAPKHPLRMRAVFRHCWLINVHMPVQSLAARLPAPLEPEVHHDRAWLSVVIAAMDDMRPCLLPRPLGVSFDQVVYRAVVRHGDTPGVFFLRTDANHRLYAWGGDLLTFFHFHHSAIELGLAGARGHLDVRAPGASVHAVFDHGVDPEALPGSLFGAVARAKPALVDRFHALSVHPRTGRVNRVTVERGGWGVRAVGLPVAELPWLSAHLPGAEVDSAVYAPDIPYVWSRLTPVEG